MSKKKDKLGKGLRALLTKIDSTETPEVEKKEAVKELTKSIAEIKVDNIEPNPFQPRIEFIEADLMDLVKSIIELGLIQPITIRSLGADKYQIISGERRWRASKLAGLSTIPAYIRTADDQGMIEMALVENIQRSDLNALEVALSYHRLIEECNLQHDELAKRVGKDRSTVTNYTRLLKLPPDIQSALRERSLSMGHAKALLGLDKAEDQLHFFKKVQSEALSVRNTEAVIKTFKTNSAHKTSSENKMTLADMHPEVRKIRDRLSHQLGGKVDISRSSKGKGKIVIHFSSDDQFNDIIDAIEE